MLVLTQLAVGAFVVDLVAAVGSTAARPRSLRPFDALVALAAGVRRARRQRAAPRPAAATRTARSSGCGTRG